MLLTLLGYYFFKQLPSNLLKFYYFCNSQAHDTSIKKFNQGPPDKSVFVFTRMIRTCWQIDEARLEFYGFWKPVYVRNLNFILSVHNAM